MIAPRALPRKPYPAVERLSIIVLTILHVARSVRRSIVVHPLRFTFSLSKKNGLVPVEMRLRNSSSSLHTHATFPARNSSSEDSRSTFFMDRFLKGPRGPKNTSSKLLGCWWSDASATDSVVLSSFSEVSNAPSDADLELQSIVVVSGVSSDLTLLKSFAFLMNNTWV